MAKYRITTPDGRKFVITGGETPPTQEQVRALIANYQEPEESPVNKEQPSNVWQAVRQAMEVPQKAMEYINPAERLRKGVAGFVDSLIRTPEEAVGKIASFEEGGTFGAGKKLGGVANAVFSSAVDAPATVGAMVANAQNYGPRGLFKDLDEVVPTRRDRYNEVVQPADAAKEWLEENKPEEADKYQLAGILASPANFAGGGFISKGSGLASKALRSGAVGGVTGGSGAIGKAKDFNQLVDEGLSEAGVSAAISAAFPVAGSAWNAAKKGAGKFIGSVLGTTTGAAGDSLAQAYDAGKRGSKVFAENMRRPRATAADIVQIAKDSLNSLRSQRNDLYRQEMQKIGGMEGISLQPIIDKINKVKQSFGGSRAYLLDDHTAKLFNKVNYLLKNFSKDPTAKDITAFDELKRAIRNIALPREARAASTAQAAMADAVRGEITRQAPVYSRIMKDYQEAADAIDEMERVFSLGRGSTGDTALRKFQSVFRNNVNSNYGNRSELLKQLENGSNEISDMLAGQTLNALEPRGLAARIAGTIGGAGTGVAATAVSPAFWGALAALPAFSPRVMGEAAYLAGRTSKYIPSVFDIPNPAVLYMNFLNNH